MLKFATLILTAGVSACIPPQAPPPNFRPIPPFAPEPVDPGGENTPTQPEPPPPPTATGGYPTATRTANPDQVLSPYEPYNVIDVAGFKSGQLARDPSNRKIFRVP